MGDIHSRDDTSTFGRCTSRCIYIHAPEVRLDLSLGGSSSDQGGSVSITDEGLLGKRCILVLIT
jgi:hypothetical protein